MESHGTEEVAQPRPPTRSVRGAAFEIAGMALALLLVMVLVALRYPAGPGPRTLTSWAAAGNALLPHLGATFGVYVPTLLAFYALVVGKQLVDAPRFAARTRRVLGRVAELMAACLVPAMVPIGAACIRRPELVGVLFAVVPMTGLVFFLALQLGSFAIIEAELRRELARESLTWASDRLAILNGAPRERWVWIFLLNGMLLGILGSLVEALVDGATPEGWLAGTVRTLLWAAMGTGVTVILLMARFLGITIEGIAGRLLSWATTVLLWLIAAFQLLFLMVDQQPSDQTSSVPAGMAAITLAASLSIYFPHRKVSWPVGGWTVAAVVDGMAAAELERVKFNSESVLKHLAPPAPPVRSNDDEPDRPTEVPRWRRLRNAVQALRS